MEAIIEKTYYLDEHQFTTLKQAWTELVKKRTITRADLVLYNVLRGKDIKRGFIERKTNIQGNNAWFAFNKARLEAKIIVKNSFAKRFGFIPPNDLLAKLA